MSSARSISSLLPIDVDSDGDRVAKALAESLCAHGVTDIRCLPLAVRIVASFAKYEETGSVEEFSAALNRFRRLSGEGSDE